MTSKLELDQIPNKIEKWNIKLLNRLIRIKSIEGENFDFKKEIQKGFEQHICAFANTSGGYIVLGINELKTNTGDIIGFKKAGFKTGKEDSIIQSISNYCYSIEPHPEIQIKLINEGSFFYPIIRINSENSKKPYFTKDGRCFIRLGNTSPPANRSTILNLTINKQISREEIIHHSKYINEIFKKIRWILFEIENKMMRIKVPDDPTEYSKYYFDFLNLHSSSRPLVVYLDRLTHIDWALSHLQDENYNPIKELLNNSHQLVSEYNETSKLLQEIIRNLCLQKNNQYLYNSDNEFSLGNTIHLIYNLLYSFPLDKKKFREFLIYNEYSDNSSVLHIEYQNYNLFSFRTNKDNNLKLFKFIKSLYNNRRIIGKIKRMKEIIEKKDEVQKEIHEKMRNIVLDINAGETIKGYCKIGY